MNANNNNNKKTQTKKQAKSNKKFINPFKMDITDDFYDPFEKEFFGFDNFENRMFRNFKNIFNDFGIYETPKEEEKKEEKPQEVKPVEPKEKKEEPKEEEINTNTKMEEEKEEPKEEEINTNTKMEEEKEEPKEEEINTNTEPKEEKEEPKEEKENNGTYYSKVYYSSYNNLNGKPNEECYQSQTVKQTKNGHDIAETKEAYKNSNGVQKTAYQRDLDGKTARFIKENNVKTGKKNQKRVVKGIEENKIKDFNKEYNDYCKKCGFRKNFHNLDLFDPFGFNNKKQHLLTDGNLLLHSLLF